MLAAESRCAFAQHDSHVWIGFLRPHLAPRPVEDSQKPCVGVLLLLSLPDVWLLSDGAAGAFPGATLTGVGVLTLMHVAAAAVIVWFLTVRPRIQV